MLVVWAWLGGRLGRTIRASTRGCEGLGLPDFTLARLIRDDLLAGPSAAVFKRAADSLIGIICGRGQDPRLRSSASIALAVGTISRDFKIAFLRGIHDPQRLDHQLKTDSPTKLAMMTAWIVSSTRLPPPARIFLFARDGANHRNSTSVNARVNRFFSNSNEVDRFSQR